MRGIVVAVDGSHAVRVSVEGLRDDAAALGRNAAQQALAEGAGALLP
ncbi:MAG: hypothetical protein IIA27_10410 [Gemmatimonadetes bacterium]|nr:hypothetical protein [Gemmatimonadota bacterium]